MKYKLPRQRFLKEYNDILKREIKAQDNPTTRCNKKRLHEILEVCRVIEREGIPEKFVVKKLSKDLGDGVFLHPKQKPLKRGTLIAPYSGLVKLEAEDEESDSSYTFEMLSDITLTKQEQAALFKHRKYNSKRKYCLNLDAEKEGNFTRFINHSSLDPNVEAHLVTIPNNGLGVEPSPIEVIYVAKKTIRAGEQLLVCYEDEDESYWGVIGVSPYPMDPQTFQINEKLNLVQVH